MKASKTARDEAGQLFRLCLVEGLLNEERAQQVVEQIGQTKPRGYLGILWHFHRLVQVYREQHTAKVETATTLPAEVRTRVQGELGRIYGQGLSISFSENSALIGGMRIRVGSDVYDGSVRGRLEVLKQSF